MRLFHSLYKWKETCHFFRAGGLLFALFLSSMIEGQDKFFPSSQQRQKNSAIFRRWTLLFADFCPTRWGSKIGVHSRRLEERWSFFLGDLKNRPSSVLSYRRTHCQTAAVWKKFFLLGCVKRRVSVLPGEGLFQIRQIRSFCWDSIRIPQFESGCKQVFLSRG